MHARLPHQSSDASEILRAVHLATAAHLNISIRAVRSHLERIRAKAGRRHRVEHAQLVATTLDEGAPLRRR